MKDICSLKKNFELSISLITRRDNSLSVRNQIFLSFGLIFNLFIQIISQWKLLRPFFFLNFFFVFNPKEHTKNRFDINLFSKRMQSFDLFVRLLFNQFPQINKFSWITVLPYTFSENVETEYCFGSKYFPPYFLSLPGMHPLICSTPKTGMFEHQFQKCRNILSKYTLN